MLQEFRYAWRGLRRTPGFTVVAVLSLALGIGANATIFGLFYSALLRPLPYTDAQRLIAVGRADSGKTGAGAIMTPELVSWRVAGRDFEGVAGWDEDQPNLTGAGTPERLHAAAVTSNFLDVLGQRPMLGRGFVPADGRIGAPQVLLLSNRFWIRHFAGDRSVVGRSVFLNDQAAAIGGVLPPNFLFPGDFDPDALVVRQLDDRPDWAAHQVEFLHAIGRLRRGASAERAAIDLAAITAGYAPGMFSAWKSMQEGTRVVAIPLQREMAGDTRPLLVALLGGVGLLLLIACVNVANLQLGRAAGRRREVALRAALGAGGWRLARPMIVESLVLSAMAGAAGLVLSLWLADLLRTASGLPVRSARGFEAGGAVALAAFVLVVLAGVFIGVTPAITASRLRFHEVLKSGALGILGGHRVRIRAALVSVQMALALVLLIGSSLLLRSLLRVVAIDPGFRPQGVLTATLRLTEPRYETNDGKHAVARDLLTRLQAMPGVQAAALTSSIPLQDYSLVATTWMADDPRPAPGKGVHIASTTVTPDFFQALAIPLLAGRVFNGQDRQNSERVGIVNARFVQTIAGSRDVIGKRIYCGAPGPVTIVGVVGNVRHAGREQPALAEIYLPESQAPSRRIHLVVRTAKDPGSLATALRAAVWSVDKDLPVDDVITMERRLADDAASRRMETLLLAAFALVALILAAVGIYGVVAEGVGQRTGEIGLRVALGANPAGVVRMVLGGSLVFSAVGVAAGYAAGIYLSRFLSKLLFQIKPADGVAMAVSGGLLLLVAAVACYVPARRAANIDPVAALRCE
jgi:putative ABC transport system permease protein